MSSKPLSISYLDHIAFCPQRYPRTGITPNFSRLADFLWFGTLSCLDPAEIKLPKRPAPEVEYLTNGEIQRVLDAIKVDTFTGMRISEALSLKRLQFDDGKSEAEIIGKGKWRRTIFFTQRCRLWVQEPRPGGAIVRTAATMMCRMPLQTFRRP